MSNRVVHFAIHADDLARARGFYESVFGWRFEPWGAPDFFQILVPAGGDPGIRGAMQHRRYSVIPKEIVGYECTIEVADVDSTAAAIEARGGKILMPRTAIPSVGWLIKFLDTEGNLAFAIRFDAQARQLLPQ